jgi:hypothetical protein
LCGISRYRKQQIIKNITQKNKRRGRRRINEELDNARKRERKAVNKIENQEEKVKLKEVYKYFKKIKIMHLKKENIRKIYESAKNWEEGLEKIGKWLQQARKIFPEIRNNVSLRLLGITYEQLQDLIEYLNLNFQLLALMFKVSESCGG